MNWPHFRAFVWLRWRLFANQMAKGGILNQIFLMMALVSAALIAILSLFVSFGLGWYAVPQISAEYRPLTLLLIWDGLVLLFLFSWCIGLLTELQRSEAFTLSKFLHLPVSIGSAFVLNYLSSLVSLTLLLFLPMMLGFCAGLVLGLGPAYLAQFLAAAAFLFAATALTYHFQGWLASLMVNKRRRRTIIVVVTLLFIVVFQLPNLINVFQPWKMGEEELKVELAEVDRAYAAKKITDLERTQQKNAIQQRHREQGRATLKWLEEWAWIANMVLPIGWPACGAAAAAEGNPLPALLAAVGLTLIGAASLRRAYTTTMRIYTGAFTAGQQARPLPTTYAPPPPTAATAAPATFFQLRLPWVSEEASAIAVAAFRSLLRAPEVKMLLLSPIIILIIFGGVMLRHSADVPAAVRPLFSFGAMAMILFTMGQLTGNQFGYDRAGFRIFVLSPVPRRELLLGKNMAVLPIVAGMLLPLTIVVQIFQPLRIDYLLALPIQFVSMFLIYCMLANLLSIFAPMPVAMGSNKPIRPKFLPVLLHMAFVGVLPMAQGPTLLPWGIDAALTSLDLDFGVPYCLILTALECVGLVFLYRFVITAQGRLLQWREQQILEVVTTKAE